MAKPVTYSLTLWWCKASPYTLNNSHISLERLSKNLITNPTRKHRRWQRHSARVSTGEGGDGRGRVSRVNIELEMDQPFGEQKQVPNLKGLVEELVGGIDKANLEAAADDKEKLGRARVGMRWVDGASRVLEDGHGDALAEKGWELGEGGFCGFEI